MCELTLRPFWRRSAITGARTRQGGNVIFALAAFGGHLVRRAPFWGILLRLLLMPIACHYDLLSYYGLAHHVVYHHSGPLPGQLVGELYFMFPTAYLNIAWLWLIRPLLGVKDLWSHDWYPGGDVYQINEAAWRAVVSAPNIGLVLFLFKLPHLLGEWGIIRWLCAMTRSPLEQRCLSRFLWFNPVSIFVLYVFGSVEIFVMVLLVYSVFCASRRRTDLAAWILGCSAPFRLFPALFFPAFVLIFGKRPAERLRLGLWVCLPLAMWLLVMAVHYPGALSFLANYPSMNFLFSLKLQLQFLDFLYPFVIAYVFVTCACVTRAVTPLERFLDAVLATLLVYYATSFFHPQYFLWFIPFLALRVAADHRLIPLFAVQTICYVVYTFQWGRPLAGYLFAPLNPAWWMTLRAPSELIAAVCPPEKIVGLAHSVLAGVSLWMVFRIMRHGKAEV